MSVFHLVVDTNVTVQIDYSREQTFLKIPDNLQSYTFYLGFTQPILEEDK